MYQVFYVCFAHNPPNRPALEMTQIAAWDESDVPSILTSDVISNQSFELLHNGENERMLFFLRFFDIKVKIGANFPVMNACQQVVRSSKNIQTTEDFPYCTVLHM